MPASTVLAAYAAYTPGSNGYSPSRLGLFSPELDALAELTVDPLKLDLFINKFYCIDSASDPRTFNAALTETQLQDGDLRGRRQGRVCIDCHWFGRKCARSSQCSISIEAVLSWFWSWVLGFVCPQVLF